VQRVVMVANPTLSIPNALKAARPDDYYRNTATIEWPNDADGRPLVIGQLLYRAVVFKDGGHLEAAEDFVRFLVRDSWLAHYLEAARQRMLPPMRVLLDQPFWLDPGDPHLMASAMQALTRPLAWDFGQVPEMQTAARVWDEDVWTEAVHRIVADGLTLEQAADEGLARVRQLGATTF
jgi:multiple sugar transport system substrate-binding protein